MNLTRTFIQRTKARRLSMNMGQKALSKASGMALSYVAKLEGEEFSPSLDSVEKILGGLETSFPELMGWSD